MLNTIAQLLQAQRFETARRHCLALLAQPESDRNAVLRLLHQAQRHLGEIPACRATLAQMNPATDVERFTVAVLLAEDYHRLSAYDFYRGSAEADAGLTGEEYFDMYQEKAAEAFTQAKALATTDEQRRELAEVLRRCQRAEEADALCPPTPPASPVADAPLPTGVVCGTLTFPDGTPVADALVTLGLQVDVIAADPATYLKPEMGYSPKIGEQRALTTRTDATGAFRIDDVPATRHEFLAVTLDPAQYAIPTRFLAENIDVQPNAETRLDRTVKEWQSAAPREIAHPFAPMLRFAEGDYTLVDIYTMANPFYFPFPRQAVTMELAADVAAAPQRLLLLASTAPETPQPFQVSGNALTFFAELPEVSDRVYALYQADGVAPRAALSTLLWDDAGDGTAVIDTGRARFRIPIGAGADAQPPLLAVMGEDGAWRGQGRFVLPEGVQITGRETTLLDSGPLVLSVRIAYTLSTGDAYAITFTAHRDEAYLLAREVCPDLPGMAFQFSLREFNGGRGFLHWTPEAGGRHWSVMSAQDRELARLQESVAWWIPPQGFGYAMTADGVEQTDYIGVFTIQRGEWIDRKFAAISQGPGENRELDWPYPEMVGSTVSMITAHTSADGDAYFHFKAFDGERRWGILVSTLERNDGPHKEISKVEHKNSSPRLQDFMHWRLDEQDHVQRPQVVMSRDALTTLRRKKDDPAFANYWRYIMDGNIPGPAKGVRFAIDGDPLVAWRVKRTLTSVAQIRSRMTLFGRDYADSYSPVGARPITPWAEEYDLVAASGVFSPEEERLVRAFLMLMGHMYMETDLMNWKFNARNANFDADRVDVVGTVGLTFHGNPDADAFAEHTAGSMARALDVYCTPGSGKWYENPACYYLQAMKCRTNVAYHLAIHDRLDLSQIPLFKDFLRWGVILLTPRTPDAYSIMCNGCDDATYRTTHSVRRLPPVGDHAHIGPWVPEHYAVMAKAFRAIDPELADLLLWAYQEGGADGGYHGNIPLLFSQLDNDDLRPAPAQQLVSRLLESFGSIFRGNFGQPDEFYLLYKLGPGGYRYHRTEGSIILFADGKPLIYDGGEAGETWRHTTLSFNDTHTALAPGHIERFVAFPGVEFAQGVNPKALMPGEPNFLSDLCDDYLVEVAHERFNEPNPADVRSVIWVKDEYVILHDDLNLPENLLTHWHLQAVAQGETGNAAEGYRFTGRFGTDLQLLLPGQSFAAESVETLPILEYNVPKEQCFAMRHLQLTTTSPSHVLAVLRPLPAGKGEVTAQEITVADRCVGVRVQGDGIDDQVFHSREAFSLAEGMLSFTGRYGTVLRRADRLELALLDGTRLAVNNVTITSDGPAVHLVLGADGAQLVAEGTGAIEITLDSITTRATLDGPRQEITLPVTVG